MEIDSSSGEESDRQKDTKDNRFDRHDDHIPTRSSTFDINDIRSSIRRRFKLIHLIIVILLLPLIIVLINLSSTNNARSYFSVADLSALRPDSVADRIQKSELRALYLLKQQQVSLFSILNRTLLNLSANSSSRSIEEDERSAVLTLISLNKEIQDVLLSAHGTGNFSGKGDVFPGGCRRKVDRRVWGGKKSIEWKPRKDKYLFAICLSGQMSNRLICLEKHMFFAAVLNRILVIPGHRFDYRYSRVIDIDHINTCLGREAVVSFEDFVERRKKKSHDHHHVHIDRFICYFSSPEPCYVDDVHMKKLKGLGISIGGKLEAPWVEDISKPSKKTVEEVEGKLKSEDDVIAIGDVFYAKVEEDWVMQPGGPIAHKCKSLIEPSRLIFLTAQRFIQTFLGRNYVALHFRRHGFLKFCNVKRPSCFYPIPQAANCMTRLVERVNAPVIYLSTDAAESETSLLQSLITVNGKTVPLVKRPARNSAEKWDALLYRHGIEGDSQVEAMLDKTICAMSNVFIGAFGSTFTEDILRLRKDWRTASECDEYLCQGEEPNFIAEDES